ncbi:MAG: DUF374 domain-containing protein [Puniceicoccales bacterium]|jgi:lysophospholipid acyltransferase (LPLAT)-like uncharacterized protein|nr:DUF374 domain-containing protein [Puniceicoccales bacterium]
MPTMPPPSSADTPPPAGAPSPVLPAPSASSSPSPEPRKVQRIPWWLYALLAPAALFLRLWLRTLRIRSDPALIQQWHDAGPGRVFLLWHNRLLLCPELKRRFVPDNTVNGLVSASKDGAWLTAFFRLMGVNAIRGSSSWRGGAAMLEILRALKANEDVGITPDGPRGPCYSWKNGPLQIAQKSGAPLFLLGARFYRAKRLASWDGFYIPLPFSRIDLLLDPVPPDDPDRLLPDSDFSAAIHRRLLALTDDTGFPAANKTSNKSA